MQPFLLEGVSAFSDFRLRSLKQRLLESAPSLEDLEIRAVEVFFLEPAAAGTEILDNQNGPRIKSLLGAQDTELSPRLSEGFYVTPKKGAISPWSSKATDIFHNCGLTQVKRVERGIHYNLCLPGSGSLAGREYEPLLPLLHDRMTESCYQDVSDMFAEQTPRPSVVVDIHQQGVQALHQANKEMGLALSKEEIDYLYESFLRAHRNPTDAELVMFAQVNSEHCRHKIFNAHWIIDSEPRDHTLFDMIRNTHRLHPHGTLVAYKDNSGVVEGCRSHILEPSAEGAPIYQTHETRVDLVMKVETHNHPTAISPYPGAATGVGGEIRDEAATGIGARSKAGLAAFMVSNLRIPGFVMDWEKGLPEPPPHLATALQIMLEGPIGGASFGNEFGRPALAGIFRTFEAMTAGLYRGYHKPIMAAGGMGNIRRLNVHKHSIPPGARIVQIGGPALRIGLGGGAASSMGTGSNNLELDFNSVQRDNPEMQRRCQGVIDTCTAAGKRNPILSIHDIGAGGLSNGCPELIEETGGKFFLRRIHNEEHSMNPMEIWCCEAQERYVLAIAPENIDRFQDICRRERCPCAVIGEASGDGRLTLFDDYFNDYPIDMDISVLLGNPPRMTREADHVENKPSRLQLEDLDMAQTVENILHLPAVADKTFLITIADRSVTGLVARDQMVGPYQTPLADVAVTAAAFDSYQGEAMAIGERTPVALISSPASARMAIGEALTNIAAADIGEIGQVKLSANWMCACGEDGEDAALYDAVRAVGMELCPALGLAVPVGKDSLSMRSQWRCPESGEEHKMTSPMSLLISAFAPVRDVRRTVTPELKDEADSRIILLDLGQGKNRLGASALAQVTNQCGDTPPDIDDPETLKNFFTAIQELLSRGLLLAYHDRSDGGLFVTLAEMCIGSRLGMTAEIAGEKRKDQPVEENSRAASNQTIYELLFNEELGAVLQVAEKDIPETKEILAQHSLDSITRFLGRPNDQKSLIINHGERTVYEQKVTQLHRSWSELSFKMRQLRDNPTCAQEEFDTLLDSEDPGMICRPTFNPEETNVHVSTGAPPKMAILREQGVNGQREMAAAFKQAGFECWDVHMTDLLSERIDLQQFQGLTACGGFSYGDVLGGGAGWAKSILYNEKLREMFRNFFTRPQTFTLGVCNGCQMLSRLAELIPGAEDWPAFTVNRSEQFEARFVNVEILDSPSVLLRGMGGSRLPVPVAHGEGKTDFTERGDAVAAAEKKINVMRFIDHCGEAAERYPYNPNGSPGGLTGLTTPDGRATIMMPHPERGFRAVQMSWRPPDWHSIDGPWMRMFRNARSFVE